MDEVELADVIFRAVVDGDCRALVLERLLEKHAVVKLVNTTARTHTAYARVTWVQVIAARWYVVSIVPTAPTRRMGAITST